MLTISLGFTIVIIIIAVLMILLSIVILYNHIW